MSIKCTGAELKAFYQSEDPEFWPDGSWCEDEEITVDGAPVTENYQQIPDAAKVTVAGGYVFFAGKDGDLGPSFEAHFKRWRKAQTTASIVVEVQKDKLESLVAAIAAAGGKVLR